MAKNSKAEQNNGASFTDGADTTSSPAAPAPAEKKSKGAKKPAARKTAAKKKPVGSETKKRLARPQSKKSEAYEPSDSEIRLRAYFIAERRAQLFLEGDPSNDWLEARDQLVKEASQQTKT